MSGKASYNIRQLGLVNKEGSRKKVRSDRKENVEMVYGKNAEGYNPKYNYQRNSWCSVDLEKYQDRRLLWFEHVMRRDENYKDQNAGARSTKQEQTGADSNNGLKIQNNDP